MHEGSTNGAPTTMYRPDARCQMPDAKTVDGRKGVKRREGKEGDMEGLERDEMRMRHELQMYQVTSR